MKYLLLLIFLTLNSLSEILAESESNSDLKIVTSYAESIGAYVEVDEIFNDLNQHPYLVIVPENSQKQKILQLWLSGIEMNTETSQQRLENSLRSLPKKIIKTTAYSWNKQVAELIKYYDPYNDCFSLIIDPDDDPLLKLQNKIPGILISSIQNETTKNFDTPEEISDAALTIIRGALPKGTAELDNVQKAATLATVLIGGTAIGSAYLSTNEIDFNQNVNIPSGAVFDSVQLLVEGENIGFKSKNPYLSLGTKIKLDNDFIITLAGGGSKVTSQKKSGKQDATFGLTIPFSNNDLNTQKIQVNSSFSTKYDGLDNTKITEGNYASSITYSFTPKFDLNKNPELETFKLNVLVTPFEMIGNPALSFEESIKNSKKSSYVSTSLFYEPNIDTSNKMFLQFSLIGGANYNDSKIDPIYGGNFSILITPKTKTESKGKK